MPLTSEVYEDLAIACEERKLWLELIASEIVYDGRRELERIDVTPAGGGKPITSCIIVPGLAGGIYSAAAVMLERLTKST